RIDRPLVIGPGVEDAAAGYPAGERGYPEGVLDDVELVDRDVLHVVSATIDVPVGEVCGDHLPRPMAVTVVIVALASLGRGCRTGARHAGPEPQRRHDSEAPLAP